ncbi:MAG: 4'-phosphopantetheinyl transferase superfamily protein [Desulfobacteraceae bacterium]|nr:4'-phosphopantetheinyl transferase superfamily protein [Desulfobacteraceae bacterium]
MNSPAPRIHPVVIKVPEDQQKLTGRQKVSNLRKLARCALAYSAQYAGLELGELKKDESGAPEPINGIFWSLTHKNTYVAAIAHIAPVGIDIEARKNFSQGLYKRLARPEEWFLAPLVDDSMFMRYWTAKEAVLKAAGVGLTGLSHCLISEITDDLRMKVAYKKTTWRVEQHWVDNNHIVSLTSDKHAIQWHLNPTLRS